MRKESKSEKKLEGTAENPQRLQNIESIMEQRLKKFKFLKGWW